MKHRSAFLSALFGLCLVTLAATSTAQTSIQAIAEAKKKAFGVVVSVAGRVTVANEFGGPSYIQDATGGIAIFDTTFHKSVVIGDSVEVTGQLTDFQATTNMLGTGLTELVAPTGSSPNQVQWRVIPPSAVPRIAPTPREVKISEINETLEGQLLRLNNITFTTTATFQGNVNYIIRDAAQTSATTQLRIGSRTNLVGLKSPPGNQAVTCVLSQFRGAYQVLPRFASDLGLQATANPGDTVPKSRTFDVTTWNLKWFGLPRDANGAVLGPADSLLQLRNVIRVIDSIDADLYGVEEVANVPLFRQIADSLPRYGLVVAPFTQTQKTAFIFKKSVVDTIRTRTLLTGTQFAAGRVPFSLQLKAKINSIQRDISAVVIHAKAGATDRDYMLRTTDAAALYSTANGLPNMMLMGDFNDDLTTSIVGGQPSPYLPFMRDTVSYFAPSLALAKQGLVSFSSGTALIDNMIVSNTVKPGVFVGAEKVENPYYISSYVSATSDHYPVTVRFFLEGITNVVIDNIQDQPENISLNISPNPVSDLARVSFALESRAEIRTSVLDVLGREVWSQTEGVQEAGNYTLLMPTSALPQGMYLCRVQAGGRVRVLRFVVTR